MPESLPGESDIRPEFVRAIIRAMAQNDSATLNELLREGVSTAEYVEAMNTLGEGLVVLEEESVPVRVDRRDRDFEAVRLLVGDSALAGATCWADLFDALPLGRLPQLHALSEALPDGARAEYERRFGRQ